MNEWQPIDTAPLDGTVIRLKTKGGFELKGLMMGGFIGEDGEDTSSWVAIDDNHPKCWTAGACWAVNEDFERSDWPEFWKEAYDG